MPLTVIATQPEEMEDNRDSKENKSKATGKSKILKNESKDRYSNFMVVFSSIKA